MAEETPSTPGAGAVPAFDPEKMRTMIREELQQAMTTEEKDQGYHQEQQQTVAQPSVNPLQAVIEPIVAPAMRQLAVATSDARDASTFYVTHPEAVKYQADLEKMSQQAIGQGTPFTREALWHYYKGLHFDKFLQEARTEDQAKIDAARQNSDSVPGQRLPDGRVIKDAHGASDDELKTALNGVSF